MGCFEPTRQHADFAQYAQPRASLDPSPLRLPHCGQAVQQSQAHLALAIWSQARPALDVPSMASFTRMMHSQGLLSDRDLAMQLRSPAAGLYVLADGACEQIAKRTRLPKIDAKALSDRLDGASPLDRCDVVTLARRGAALGLYDAGTLGGALERMDVPEAQFPLFWWQRMQTVCGGDVGKDAEDPLEHAEFYADDDGVVVCVQQSLPIVMEVCIPGGDSEDAILVRDTLAAVVEVFIFATEGCSPHENLHHSFSLEDDLTTLRDMMGGTFTAQDLTERLHSDYANATGIPVEDVDDDSAFHHAMESFDLITPMFMGFEDFIEAAAALSDEGHWLHRSAHTYMGEGTHGERMERAHAYCLGLTEAMKERLSDRYPKTLGVLEDMLAVIKQSASRPPIPVRGGRHDDEALPLYCGTLTWWKPVGGREAYSIGCVFSEAHAESLDHQFNAGMMIGETFSIGQQDDDGPFMVNYLSGLVTGFRLLRNLVEATDAEVSAL